MTLRRIRATITGICLSFALHADAWAESPTCPSPKGWGTYSGTASLPAGTPVNFVQIGTNGSLLWNNQPLSEAQLQTVLNLVGSLVGQASVLVVDPGTADCGRFEHYRRLIETSDCSKLGCMIGKAPPLPERMPAPPPPRYPRD